MRLGPKFRLHGAWHSWCTNCKRFLWMSGGKDGQEVNEFAPCDTASFEGSEFRNCLSRISLPEVTEGWHRLKFLPTHCDLCQWSAVYWYGLSSTSFTPEVGIRLQRVSDATAFLVCPTGTATTKMELVTMPLRHAVQGSLRTSEAYRAPAQISGPWFCPCPP